MATTIYVLKLEGGKFYIGRTNKKAVERFKEHKAGKGSAWTRKYKPIGIDRIDLNGDKFDEDKVTKQYMEKYGIDNVRGGTYCKIILSRETRELILKELNGGKLDRKYPIPWNNYYNTMLVTNSGGLVVINTKLHKIIDTQEWEKTHTYIEGTIDARRKNNISGKID